MRQMSRVASHLIRVSCIRWVKWQHIFSTQVKIYEEGSGDGNVWKLLQVLYYCMWQCGQTHGGANPKQTDKSAVHHQATAKVRWRPKRKLTATCGIRWLTGWQWGVHSLIIGHSRWTQWRCRSRGTGSSVMSSKWLETLSWEELAQLARSNCCSV